jgi:hypothetical protein
MRSASYLITLSARAAARCADAALKARIRLGPVRFLFYLGKRIRSCLAKFEPARS